MNPPDSNKINVRMGEIAFRDDGGALYTLLGSCIGLALFSRRRKIGGLAHIVLPESRQPLTEPGKFADTAVPKLVDDLQRLAGEKLRLSAQIAGGASMFATTVSRNIGEDNAAACRSKLRDFRIPITAEHVGGSAGRRMTFDTSDGSVWIEIVGQEPFKLTQTV